LFLVLRLYDSKEALKIDAKLDCEMDVEGAVGVGVVDMMDRGEASISRRPCSCPNTAHSARASFATAQGMPELVGIRRIPTGILLLLLPIKFLSMFSQKIDDFNLSNTATTQN
jgi:hypothetical protein